MTPQHEPDPTGQLHVPPALAVDAVRTDQVAVLVAADAWPGVNSLLLGMGYRMAPTPPPDWSTMAYRLAAPPPPPAEPGVDEQPPVLPFITTTDQGGPHDRDSYAAGWQMATLTAVLDITNPALLTMDILTTNAPQAELICMTYGYTATLRRLDDTRTELVAFTTRPDAAEAKHVSGLTRIRPAEVKR